MLLVALAWVAAPAWRRGASLEELNGGGGLARGARRRRGARPRSSAEGKVGGMAFYQERGRGFRERKVVALDTSTAAAGSP